MSKSRAYILAQTAFLGLAAVVMGQQLPQEPVYRKDVVPDDPGWSLGPTAFEAADGNIVLVWTGGKPGSGEDSILPLWKSTSSDFGRTWTKAEVFYGEQDWGMFNPISKVLPNGDILVIYNPYQYPYHQLIDVMRSTDGGRTWSKPERIDTGSQTTATRGPVVLTNKGRLLLPYYWEASISQNKGPELWNGSCMISDDNGKSWSKGGDMPHWNHPRGASEPTIAEFSDGTLYALLRTSEACQYQSISRDGGKTWSDPVPSPFASPCSCAILTKLRSGRVLLVWNNIASHENLPRSSFDVAWTKDDGKTWHSKRLASSEEDLSNHCVLQLKNDEIIVVVGSAHPIDTFHFTEAWLDKEPLTVREGRDATNK